eukprot:CAMPEP_0197652478 /NCGR_PEP_ID=MMETSP1338-20131121/34472_1 /TAXON_ID=43686 ORGANISM="Pelagodinium beii, Strain RCC1491" /NCGR_SAMPLE_ID=MMETSP1338 /ASSEMBLY_ACC=CAM_ASM_000754 /LENGTH=266 /DNA_ID=CAMNT_0043227357 /DNA_START=32 /DNA_END=832 /DNA_ORIENTATION=+
MTGGYTSTAQPFAYKTAKSGKPAEDLRPLFLYFADVSEADLARCAAAETKDEVRKLLKDFMKIDQPEGLRAQILVDMHYHNYSFCVSSAFPPEKTSTFLSIMKIVLEDAVRLRLTPEDAFDTFQGWLLKHSVERPPRSVGIFSFDDLKLIVEYVTNTFFRHYRLYMYAFMTHCDVRLRVDEPGGGTVPRGVKPMPMTALDEVDPKVQPELAHLFRKEDEHLRRQKPEDAKTAAIKKRVEEGVKRLLEDFEGKLKEQDERFQAQMQA